MKILKIGGVVRNHLMRDSLLRQLPSRQRRALGTRPRFTAKDVELLSLLLRRIHRSGGRTIIDKGQPAGVAMSQQSGTRPDQPCAVRSQSTALFHAGLSEFLSGGNGGGLFVFDGESVGNPPANPLDCIDRIHRGRTGIRQPAKRKPGWRRGSQLSRIYRANPPVFPNHEQRTRVRTSEENVEIQFHQIPKRLYEMHGRIRWLCRLSRVCRP